MIHSHSSDRRTLEKKGHLNVNLHRKAKNSNIRNTKATDKLKKFNENHSKRNRNKSRKEKWAKLMRKFRWKRDKNHSRLRCEYTKDSKFIWNVKVMFEMWHFEKFSNIISFLYVSKKLNVNRFFELNRICQNCFRLFDI